MRILTLREYQKSDPIHLSEAQCFTLQEKIPGIVVQPDLTSPGYYNLTPGSLVGVFRIQDLQLEIRPKISIGRLFFLLSYALDPKTWLQDPVVFQEQDTVLEAVASLYCRLVAKATQRGLLHNYRSKEEALLTVRGQIQFATQLRLHHGLPLPIELRYDEYTEDIPENQILLSALTRLRRFPLRSSLIRRGLREISAAFQGVSFVNFERGRLPHFQFHRLNEHYEPAIRLAEIILNSSSPEMGTGKVYASGFLVDMNELFERFVHRALQESLRLSFNRFPRNAHKRSLFLDESQCVRLKPDLSWWDGKLCQFVGDVKYKKNESGFKHGDLYQLLAYTVATNLPSGLLIYASGEAEPNSYQVRFVDKSLEIVALDISGNPRQVLQQIDELADRIRMHHYYSAGPTQTPL